MRFSACLLVFCVGFLAVFFSLTSSAFAQQEIQSSNQLISNSANANVPQTINTLAQGVLWGMLSFSSCMVSGTDVTSSSQKCLGYDMKTGKLAYLPNQKGLIGIMSSSIASLYSPPKFHVGSYIGYMQSNFGIAKSTYAAGPSGFEQLAPIMKLWIAFRNVTYLLFVLVFVVIGFAIMLRAKIDPRTVMTIENQIPKIIVALILVSFSYAIAGLVVDIMWLVTFFTINLFGSLDPSIQIAIISKGATSNPLAILNNIAPGGVIGIIMQPASSVYDIIVPMVRNVIDIFPPFSILGLIPCYLQTIGSAISDPLGTIGGIITGAASLNGSGFVECVQNGLTQLTAGIGGVIAFLIFAFALAFSLFRLWFALLKSYALFLIYAIFGPIFIMMGVLPGTKINFDNWIRHLFAYSLVFPFAIGTMLLSKVLSDAYASSGVGYVPPLVGVTPNTVSPIGPLIGFSIILLLPQTLTMVQDALAAPDMKYLPGIGQMLAAGTQGYSTLVSKPWQRFTRRENRMEGLSEGGLRRIVLGKQGSWQRKLLGDEEGGKKR